MYKDPLHLVSNGEEPVALKLRVLESFTFKCKCKMIIMPLILKQSAPLHLRPNGEDPCPSHICILFGFS
jgi:hypothetical protein